jgi:hypothetical protein
VKLIEVTRGQPQFFVLPTSPSKYRTEQLQIMAVGVGPNRSICHSDHSMYRYQLSARWRPGILIVASTAFVGRVPAGCGVVLIKPKAIAGFLGANRVDTSATA